MAAPGTGTGHFAPGGSRHGASRKGGGCRVWHGAEARRVSVAAQGAPTRCGRLMRPTTTKWPPLKHERYVGKWPPRFKTPRVRRASKPRPPKTWSDYVPAMIERHGSVAAWLDARNHELAGRCEWPAADAGHMAPSSNNPTTQIRKDTMTTNALTVPGNDPWRQFVASFDAQAVLHGTLLRFSKGFWIAGSDGRELPRGTKLTARMDELSHGWTKW